MGFVIVLQMIAISSMVGHIYGYASGAPLKACVTQMPGHNVAAQTIPNTYTITVSPKTYNHSNPQPITVTVTGTFQGLLLQARSTGSSTTPIGVFSAAPTDTKVTQCSAAADSWTHANKNDKVNAAITWTPPSTNAGDIVFQATVAQSQNVFWMNTRSEEVKSVGPMDEGGDEGGNNGGRVTAGIMMVMAPLLLLFV